MSRARQVDTLAAQGPIVSTLDIPLKLLCKTNERKTKRKCVLKGRKAKFVSRMREGIIHGTFCCA
jgi:hypothetical protein